MSVDARDEEQHRRVSALAAADPQFAAAQPSPAVAAAVDEPGLTLAQTMQTVLDGYADRPALIAPRS
ncbi:hypothetical protein, partial [Mycolicibacterium hippocampi]|uniref:hypothetical protein n=1 Tax=Mycolicibacterium hippocampi TaxID=659824 RepID=UPI003F497F67